MIYTGDYSNIWSGRVWVRLSLRQQEILKTKNTLHTMIPRRGELTGGVEYLLLSGSEFCQEGGLFIKRAKAW